MKAHTPKVVKTGLPGNGPRKPVTVDCSCGWLGCLHSQLDSKGEETARKEWEEHASGYEEYGKSIIDYTYPTGGVWID